MQDMEFQTLSPPVWTPSNPAAPTVPETEEYKLRYKDYYDRKNKREENMKKTFVLVLGQCTQAMVDRLESQDEFEAINTDSDVIELLKLIQSCIYEKTSTKHPVQGLIEAEVNLLLCKQEPRQSIASYYAKFKEMAQIHQNNGGAPGASTARI